MFLKDYKNDDIMHSLFDLDVPVNTQIIHPRKVHSRIKLDRLLAWGS